MALTIEDGSIVAGADSYASLVYAESYVTDEVVADVTAWAAYTDAQKEAALRRARRVLDGRYVWKGVVVSYDQALSWPREGVFDREGRDIDHDSIPEAIKKAQVEIALAFSRGEFEVTDERSRTATKEKLGPLEVEYSSKAAAVSTGFDYSFIDELLVPDLAVSGSSGSQVTFGRVTRSMA